MVDSRFFTTRRGPFTSSELAALCGGELKLEQPDVMLSDIAVLKEASMTDVVFLANKSYIPDLASSSAGLCILAPEMEKYAPDGMNLLFHGNPYYAYALVAGHFYPEESKEASIHPTAIIPETVTLGTGCQIGPYVVIGEHVTIGDDTRIDAYTAISESVMIGASCHIDTHVSISHTIIGDRVRIYSGASIGKEGFGFAPHEGKFYSVPQLGRVMIGNDVFIGANTTIDRGAVADTVISDGSRIDNLVQIGHNVRLGKGCILASMVGVSGSTKLGDYVMAGGQVGFSGHLNVGSGVKIAAQSGVGKDVKPGETIGGYPAVPIQEWHRQTIALKQLAQQSRKKQTT